MLQIKLPKELPPLEDKATKKRNISILKITCEDKFYIAKTVNPAWMVEEIKNVYGKYQRNGVLETNLFFPLVKYIYRHEIHKIKVEVLLTTTNGYQALKFELEQLIQHFGKPQCLNRNNIPHIPKTEVAKKGSGWLTMNQSLNFRKLLTKYKFKKKWVHNHQSALLNAYSTKAYKCNGYYCH